MTRHLIAFVILLLSVTALLFFGRTEEAFTLNTAHTSYVENSVEKLNSLTNMVNLTDPIITIGSSTTDDMTRATQGLKREAGQTHTLGTDAKYTIPIQLPTGLENAIGCQKAPNTCSAFDDATFATNCGMGFDKEGVGSDGKPHMGGLFVAPDDRERQTAVAKKVRESGMSPYDPYKVYQPSLGVAKPGTFALTKDQCIVVKEKVECESKQTFSSPNCTQCFTSQTFSRVGPETPRVPASLFLAGQGRIRIESSDAGIRLSDTRLEPNTPLVKALPENAEGATFTVIVDSDERTPTYLSGYLEGQTGRGLFKIDINSMIQTDIVTQRKPRMMGTKTVNNFRCVSFIPGAGMKVMRLVCLLPFSFLSTYESDAIQCDNGPIVTKESSATHLESDPCYGKANGVGNYKLECLQSRWIALGGSTAGTGYPSTAEKANALQRPSGKGLTLDVIMDSMSAKMTEAITGKRNGVPLSIAEWNEVSMWGLGIPIKSPCDGLQKDSGPLSKECLAYLYQNRGTSSHIGSTYTLPSGEVASKKGIKEGWQNAGDTFMYPGTEIDPSTNAGVAFGQGLGGVDAVKQHLDDIHREANNNTLTNQERAKAVKQAYGVELPPPSSNAVPGPTQVFSVGPGYPYIFRKEEAPGICAKYGAKVATTEQLKEAHKAGADWCSSGWVADGNGKWPITTSAIPGCGGRPGIMEWTNNDANGVPRAAVNCYGAKPRPNEKTEDKIQPFNGDMWDQPTEPTYVTVKSGYLESSGPQPACFDGLSPEDAKKGCDRLGSQCAGFSYSKDGKGSGCYKGNHDAGINGNAAYMGYVKIPSASSGPVNGRYIRLDYSNVVSLNLAQILVYSSEGGPNVITATTKVTKSSGYQGDVFPSSNFVNQQGNKHYNFVHTSGGDVPWIEVDLGYPMRIHKVVVWNRVDCCQSRIMGTVLSILNEEKEKVFISSPIRTTNQSYTWMPPNGVPLLDKDPIPGRPQQRVYGNNGSTSCEQYCRGTGGGPWNNELPREWNGAKCVGHAPGIANCNSGFSYSSDKYCLCEKTGTGWDSRGWRGP